MLVIPKKSTMGIIALAVALVILASLLIHFQLETHEDNQNSQQQTQFPQVQKAILKANGYVSGGYWTRDTTTDLPDYISNIEYSVSNVGSANAVNVNVTVEIDGELYSTNLVPLLSVSEERDYFFSISTTYDSTSYVFIQVSCHDSTDSCSFSSGANLPRYWTEDSNILELYITPREDKTVKIRNEIINNKVFLIPNWIALRDWVGNSITYKYDSDTHGLSEYWQLPKETVELKSGDCEDHSILLCSLLRADGWSPNDVYVVLGKNGNNEYHAWVKINLPILGWYNIEPQGNGWNTLIGDFLSLSGYQAVCYFNDSQYHGI